MTNGFSAVKNMLNILSYIKKKFLSKARAITHFKNTEKLTTKYYIMVFNEKGLF